MAVQVISRFLWAIAYIFWIIEWLKVLWSDKVIFLIGRRTIKQKVTRNNTKRYYDIYIQYQLYRGYIIPVYA
jgi:hypothetical protein